MVGLSNSRASQKECLQSKLLDQVKYITGTPCSTYIHTYLLTYICSRFFFTVIFSYFQEKRNLPRVLTDFQKVPPGGGDRLGEGLNSKVELVHLSTQASRRTNFSNPCHLYNGCSIHQVHFLFF